MRSVPIVAVQPKGEIAASLIGGGVGSCVSPLSQRGLYEALGFSIGLWGIGAGPDRLDVEPVAGADKCFRPVARAIVGHDAADGDAEASIVGGGGLQESDGALLLFIGKDAGGGEARMVIDGHMDELPSGTSSTAVADNITRNAMAGSIETAELFDVDVDDLAGRGALVMGTWRLWLKGRKQTEAPSFEDAGNAGFGDAQLSRDLLLGAALPAQTLRGIAGGERDLAWR